MKSLVALLALFLLVPGSGQMIWDGLPMSGRLEFVALAAIVLAVCSAPSRAALRRLTETVPRRDFLKPALVLLSMIKILSFGLSPTGSGFEACYRSIYDPLGDETSCEKSYEGLFLRRGELSSLNLTRVERTIDFGRSIYDWNLPFLNEYPRNSYLWLTRLPFEVEYLASVKNLTNEVRYLPVLATGELTTSIEESSRKTVSYGQERLSVRALQPGVSRLSIRFRFSDDDSSTPPDSEPRPRGKYASLKVGETMSLSELFESASVVVELAAKKTGLLQGSDDLRVTDSLGQIIDTESMNEMKDDDSLLPIDGNGVIKVSLPMEALERGSLTVEGRLGTWARLATISVRVSDQVDPVITAVGDGGALGIEYRTYLSVDRSSLTALKPGASGTSGLVTKLLVPVLDLVAGLITMLFVASSLLALHKVAWRSLALAVITWLSIGPIADRLPASVGGGRELVIPFAIIALSLGLFARRPLVPTFVALLPMAVLLSHNKVADFLEVNHDDPTGRWWGRLFFVWRDSDWFTAQGNARAILTSGSLRGGEDVFWFHIGSRYLHFLVRVLVGENDVIIGLISVTLGFAACLYLAVQIQYRHPDGWGLTLAVATSFISLLFIGDELVTGFGFVLSSEYPTWLVLFVVASVLKSDKFHSDIRLASMIGATLGLAVQFRPNLLFVSVALVLLLVGRLDWSIRPASTKTAIGMTTAFLTVLPLSLIHNLYYGRSFVPFSGNASINYAFRWKDLMFESSLREASETLATQARALMYWGRPHDANFAIFFWGAQLLLIVALTLRVKRGRVSPWVVGASLLPLSYILPMLQFQYSSYFPRHLVAASLLCLVSATLIWPEPREPMPQ